MHLHLLLSHELSHPMRSLFQIFLHPFLTSIRIKYNTHFRLLSDLYTQQAFGHQNDRNKPSVSGKLFAVLFCDLTMSPAGNSPVFVSLLPSPSMLPVLPDMQNPAFPQKNPVHRPFQNGRTDIQHPLPLHMSLEQNMRPRHNLHHSGTHRKAHNLYRENIFPVSDNNPWISFQIGNQ